MFLRVHRGLAHNIVGELFNIDLLILALQYLNMVFGKKLGDRLIEKSELLEQTNDVQLLTKLLLSFEEELFLLGSS